MSQETHDPVTSSIEFDPDPERNEAAVRKCLHLLLLLSVRDKAKSLFMWLDDDLYLSYCVGETRYELVPMPGYVWPQLLRIIRLHSRDFQPWSEPGLVRRVIGAIAGKRANQSSGMGWLSYRVYDQRHDISYVLDLESHPASLSFNLTRPPSKWPGRTVPYAAFLPDESDCIEWEDFNPAAESKVEVSEGR